MCLGVPGEVIDVRDMEGIKMGKVDFGGVKRLVCLEHVDVVPGDFVLVHVGFALTKLAKEEAEELLAMIKEIAGYEELPEEVS